LPDKNKCACGNIKLKDKDYCLDCLIKQFNKGQRKPPSHIEDDIQAAFFTWVSLELPKLDKLIFAVPNGGKRNVKEAKRFKQQGVKKGISDIVCLVSNGEYTCLCLECKTEEGEQSEDQKAFEKQITEAGGLYDVFRSAEEGVKKLRNYLKTTAYV